MSDTLTPKLTALDQRVLAMLPEFEFSEALKRAPSFPTAHSIAEALDTDDVKDTRQILGGLEHLRYAHSAVSKSRKVRVYWRRPESERNW